MKKGQAFGLGSLISVVIIFVIAALAAVFSLDVLTDTQKDMCDGTYDNWDSSAVTCYTCSSTSPNYNSTDDECYNGTSGAITGTAAALGSKASYNATGEAITGVARIPEKLPTLGNVVIAAIIIGVLLAAFGGFVSWNKNQ